MRFLFGFDRNVFLVSDCTPIHLFVDPAPACEESPDLSGRHVTIRYSTALRTWLVPNQVDVSTRRSAASLLHRRKFVSSPTARSWTNRRRLPFCETAGGERHLGSSVIILTTLRSRSDRSPRFSVLSAQSWGRKLRRSDTPMRSRVPETEVNRRIGRETGGWI